MSHFESVPSLSIDACGVLCLTVYLFIFAEYIFVFHDNSIKHHGVIFVSYLDINGFISNEGWDDGDAQLFCNLIGNASSTYFSLSKVLHCFMKI